MRELLPQAEKIAALLKARKETIVVAESAAGGLMSAALLAVPGASAYFISGGALYTRQSIRARSSAHGSVPPRMPENIASWVSFRARMDWRV